MTWFAGKQLKDGKYTVKTLLGQGGFGVTYLAKDNVLGRDIVIKTTNEKLKYDPKFAKFQAIFKEEAKRLAKFQHRHIVHIYETFDEGQVCCMVMEYIYGSDLFEIVAKNGALPEVEALRYILQIGDALITVHQHRLLHRDINPRNIILRAETSEAVLIDFGIAREFTREYSTGQLTISQGYSPPEQYSNQSMMSPSSDVYSLAATSYFLLTAATPNSAIDRIMGYNLIPPKVLNPTIANRVNQAILTGMSLKVNSRPQSMQEWLELVGFKVDKDVHFPSVILGVNNASSQLDIPLKNSTNKFLQVARFNSSVISWIALVFAILSFLVSLSKSPSFIYKIFPTPTPTPTPVNSQSNK